MDNANPIYDSRNDCNAVIETATNTLIIGCQNTIIPNEVRHIAPYVFSDHNITSITLPDSLITIGDWAFLNCPLTEVTLGEKVTRIGYDAFGAWRDSTLKKVICYAEVPPRQGSYWWDYYRQDSTFHPERSFYPDVDTLLVPCSSVEAYKADSLWRVSFRYIGAIEGDSVSDTTITDFAVDGIYYHVLNDSSSTVTIVGCDSFLNDIDLYFPDTVIYAGKVYILKEIGRFAFEWQSHIRTIELPYSITYIRDSAFYGCYGLRELTLGESIQYIGSGAFLWTNNLRIVTCRTTTPPELGYYQRDQKIDSLLVPCSSVEAYKNDTMYDCLFKYIGCIGAQKVPVDTFGVDTTTTTPNAVVIMWPSEEEAHTYTLNIYLNGELFCTIVFDMNGRIIISTFIRFSRGRMGVGGTRYATRTSNEGFSYTLTGLEGSTEYSYELTSKRADETVISTHEGSFKTSVATVVEYVTIGDHSKDRKVYRDGQVVIIRDGEEYSVTGAKIRIKN